MNVHVVLCIENIWRSFFLSKFVLCPPCVALKRELICQLSSYNYFIVGLYPAENTWGGWGGRGSLCLSSDIYNTQISLQYLTENKVAN